jgi:hypothetical protein
LNGGRVKGNGGKERRRHRFSADLPSLLSVS